MRSRNHINIFKQFKNKVGLCKKKKKTLKINVGLPEMSWEW